jgi:uncharacterized protein
MDITGERRLLASRARVWEALNDPDVLRECIPGCQKLEKVSDTVIEATIAAQIGPVKAPFGTRIELKDLDPPNGYTIVGEGKSSAAGFGRGEARVTLEEDGGTTVLRYVAELKLGGRLAQIGARLVEGATRQLADQFFTKFAARFEAAPPADGTPPAVEPSAPGAGRGWLPWLIAGALGIVGLMYWIRAHGV